MSKINLTIDLDEDLGEFNENGELVMSGTMSEAIRDRVVQLTVQRIIGKDDRQLRNEVTELVRGIVQTEVKERIAAILGGSIQRTDAWGAPKGEPTSIAELVQEATTKWLEAPKRDRSYNQNAGNMGELVEDLVKEAVAKDLKPTIDAARKQVQTAIVDQALAGAVAAIAPKVPTR